MQFGQQVMNGNKNGKKLNVMRFLGYF